MEFDEPPLTSIIGLTFWHSHVYLPLLKCNCIQMIIDNLSQFQWDDKGQHWQGHSLALYFERCSSALHIYFWTCPIIRLPMIAMIVMVLMPILFCEDIFISCSCDTPQLLGSTIY